MSVQAAIGSSVFQEAIEGVERIPVDAQLLLVEIVKHCSPQHRRAELTTVIAEAREAYRTGNVRRGTPEDLLKELEESDE